MLGTSIVWGAAALYQLAHSETGLAVGILLVGVIVNADNVLRMVLASRMGNIHPLLALVGMTLGLVIGPLLLSYRGVLMEVFAEENHWTEAPPTIPKAAVPAAA